MAGDAATPVDRTIRAARSGLLPCTKLITNTPNEISSPCTRARS